MTASLLATKYHRPAPAPDLVTRPQVTRLLEAGLHGRLILVSAPAGFGKTTLITSWLTERLKAEGERMKDESYTDRTASSAFSFQPSTFAWLSLDADDNAPMRFWAYVIAALQTAVPAIGRVAQAALQTPQPPPIEPTLTALINDLVALDHPLLLVLDDYHVITTPEIHRGLDFLLEHLPEQLRLTINTREDPPLALARLRARGQLTEIRADDLRFSEAETEAFVNTVQSLALARDDVATLVARTEGWITGLRLAALSLQHTSDRHGFVTAFSASHRFVTDYLLDEVLNQQPPHRKAFLLQTAILDRLCGPLCDAILKEEGRRMQDEGDIDRTASSAFSLQPSAFSLQELDRANVFLVPLDNERHWFRYHHLFAEFLRLRLREAEPERVAVLYRRAIAWCTAHGLLRDALGYALAAPDYDRAADLIEALAPDVLSQEGPGAVLQWVAALPAPLVRQRPALCVQYAWALTFAGRMVEAANYLAVAESASSTADALTRQHVNGQVAAHRAYVQFFRGEFTAALHEAQRALDHLPAEETVLRIRTAVVLSSVLRFTGQLQAAEEALTPLADAIEATSNVYTATLYYSSLGEIHQERGRLHQAQETFGRALAFAARHTGRSDIPFTGFAHVAIGHVQREWNDLDAAAASISRGITLCREWRQADALAIGLVELAQLHQDRGELELAQQALNELRQIVETMGSPWGVTMAATCQARLDLARGDLAAADRWVIDSGLAVEDPPSFERIDDYQTLGQVLVVRGDHDGAVRVLDRLARQSRAAGQIDRLLAALVWQARALAESGRHDEALAPLDQALRLGEPGGYVRVFVAGGAPVAELLEGQSTQRKTHSKPSRQYIERLLGAFPGQTSSANPPIPAEPALRADFSALRSEESLNDRERAILRLMAAGLSNRAIGDELALSVNTVRWYASQIFAKLGVSGRGAAVAESRRLGLL